MRPRFRFYRKILAGFLSRGFQDHPIEPLAEPVDTEIDHVPHDELWPDLSLPGVRVAATFIPSDHAERRRAEDPAADVAARPAGRPGAEGHAADPGRRAARSSRRSTHAAFDKAGVRRPVLPPELRGRPGAPADVLAELAVRGPFGSFLRRATADEVAAGEAAEDEYVVDLSHYLDHPAKPGCCGPAARRSSPPSESGLRDPHGDPRRRRGARSSPAARCSPVSTRT